MVDNWLPIFDMNKEMKKEPKKNIEEKLGKIINDIEVKKIHIKKHTAIIKYASLLVDKITPQANVEFDKNFHVEDTCNGCKVCAKVCPVDNIKADKKPVFKRNCQQCLACINHCPQNAIRLKSEKSKARFINQNITNIQFINVFFHIIR